MSFLWIELVLFYGFAIGFAAWQVWKTNKELKEERAQRLEKEARQKAEEEEGNLP